uniref:Uncharacterized protein n=1 Tax=Balaenoptera musculus TaxID=9771 RepID=A0A8C0DQW2_BALMU
MDWVAMATDSTVASAGVCVLVPGGVLTQCVFTLKRKMGPQLVEIGFNFCFLLCLTCQATKL